MLGTISCLQATEWISQNLDQPLVWSKRIRLDFHKKICPSCKLFAIQIEILHRNWPKIKIEEVLPGLSDEDKLKIQAHIDEHLS